MQRRTEPTSVPHADALIFDTEWALAHGHTEPELEDEFSYLVRLHRYIAKHGVGLEREASRLWLEDER